MGSFLEYLNLVCKWVINGTNQDFSLSNFLPQWPDPAG